MVGWGGEDTQPPHLGQKLEEELKNVAIVASVCKRMQTEEKTMREIAKRLFRGDIEAEQKACDHVLGLHSAGSSIQDVLHSKCMYEGALQWVTATEMAPARQNMTVQDFYIAYLEAPLARTWSLVAKELKIEDGRLGKLLGGPGKLLVGLDEYGQRYRCGTSKYLNQDQPNLLSHRELVQRLRRLLTYICAMEAESGNGYQHKHKATSEVVTAFLSQEGAEVLPEEATTCPDSSMAEAGIGGARSVPAADTTAERSNAAAAESTEEATAPTDAVAAAEGEGGNIPMAAVVAGDSRSAATEAGRQVRIVKPIAPRIPIPCTFPYFCVNR